MGPGPRAQLRTRPGRRGNSFAFPRRIAPELLKILHPQEDRGRRECRMRAAPAVSCATCTKESAHEHTGQRRTSDIPCAMALRLIRGLPGEPMLCCHRRPSEALASLALDASIGASGPHDFAVRFRAYRQGASASTATRPTFVTMADAPLSGTGWVRCARDLGMVSSRISENQKLVMPPRRRIRVLERP